MNFPTSIQHREWDHQTWDIGWPSQWLLFATKIYRANLWQPNRLPIVTDVHQQTCKAHVSAVVFVDILQMWGNGGYIYLWISQKYWTCLSVRVQIWGVQVKIAGMDENRWSLKRNIARFVILLTEWWTPKNVIFYDIPGWCLVQIQTLPWNIPDISADFLQHRSHRYRILHEMSH